jgi:hypothetical protein
MRPYSVEIKRCTSSLAFCVKNYTETTETRSPAPSSYSCYASPSIVLPHIPLRSTSHSAGLMAIVIFDKDKLFGLTDNMLVGGGGE